MEKSSKPTISVVMIVKNEMEFLERCLESVKEADEIIICDTGSTDNGETVRIARKYTDKVYEDYKWNDSFCEARNHAKSKATCDWIFSIDADEFCHDFSKAREAIELAEKRGIRAVNILQIAEDHTEAKNTFPRIFRNDPDIRWFGAAHNYINVPAHDIGNVVITYGYSLAHLQDPDRTLRILERENKEGRAGARELFYLGREYFYRNKYQEATKTLGHYVQISNFLAEKADAFLMMAHCYWKQGLGDDARDACLQAIKINAHFKEAIIFMAEITGNGRDNPRWQKNADQWLRMAETADNSDVLFVRNV